MQQDSAYSLSPRLAEGRIALYFVALFTVYGVVTPYLQKLLALQGFDERWIGFIVGAMRTSSLVAPFFWGWLSDRSLRRRRLLAGVILGAGLCLLALGWVRRPLPALALGLLAGFFYTSIVPLSDGLVLRYIHEHGGDYGRPRSAGSMAFVAVICLMEWCGVAGAAGREVILLFIAGSFLLHFLAVPLLPLTGRERRERRAGRREGLRLDFRHLLRRPLLVFLAIAFLGRFGMAGYYNFFTLFLQREIGFEQAGLLWSLGTLAEIPLLFFSGRIIRRVGARRLFLAGLAGIALRLTGYALAPDIWWVLPLQLLHALTFGAFFAASVHYVQHHAPSELKQTAMAMYGATVFGASAIVGGAVGGLLIHHFGYRAMYGSYACVAGLALLLGVLLLEEPEIQGSQR